MNGVSYLSQRQRKAALSAGAFDSETISYIELRKVSGRF